MELNFAATYRGKEYPRAHDAFGAASNFFGQYASQITPGIRTALTTYLQSVAKSVAARASGPWPGGTTSDSISTRSGAALADILATGDTAIQGSSLGMLAEINLLGYLAIHESGGTIHASGTEYLAIPLRDALDPRGVPIKPSPRDWGNTFVAKSRAGNLLIFRRDGRRLTPLYLLKKSVDIPARLGYYRTLTGTDLVKFMNSVNDLVGKEFQLV